MQFSKIQIVPLYHQAPPPPKWSFRTNGPIFNKFGVNGSLFTEEFIGFVKNNLFHVEKKNLKLLFFLDGLILTYALLSCFIFGGSGGNWDERRERWPLTGTTSRSRYAGGQRFEGSGVY